MSDNSWKQMLECAFPSHTLSPSQPLSHSFPCTSITQVSGSEENHVKRSLSNHFISLIYCKTLDSGLRAGVQSTDLRDEDSQNEGDSKGVV